MTIYLDADYKCHTAPGEGLVAVETDAFEGKCAAYIEGYRLVPSGQTWVRSDGVEFQGEMLAPWKPWKELDEAQRAYEREQYDTIAAENAAMTAQLTALDEEYQKGVNSL